MSFTSLHKFPRKIFLHDSTSVSAGFHNTTERLFNRKVAFLRRQSGNRHVLGCSLFSADLREEYPQVLWSILLVGKLLQIFGFFYFRHWQCIKLHLFNASNASHNYGSPATCMSTCFARCARYCTCFRGICSISRVKVSFVIS